MSDEINSGPTDDERARLQHHEDVEKAVAETGVSADLADSVIRSWKDGVGKPVPKERP